MKLTTLTTLCLGTLAAAIMLAPAAKSDDASATLYKQKCAGCHGADGKADSAMGKAMKIKSFADPDVVKMSDADLSDIIEKGKGKMPAYKTLTAEQVKGLVAYIRELGKK